MASIDPNELPVEYIDCKVEDTGLGFDIASVFGGGGGSPVAAAGAVGGGINPITGMIEGAAHLTTATADAFQKVVGMFRGDQVQKNVKLGLQVDVKKAQIDRIKSTQNNATILTGIVGGGAAIVAMVIILQSFDSPGRKKAANPRRR